MTDPDPPYERTDVEFEAVEPNSPWEAAKCTRCGRVQGFHWQTADGKVWCVHSRSTAQGCRSVTPRQTAELRARQAAERLQRANDELAAAEREHRLANESLDNIDHGDAPPAVPIECGCPAKTCQPEKHIGRFCWRTGCPIYAKDFDRA